MDSNTPGGVAWVNTGGSFVQLDAGTRGEVYAVDNKGQLYTREGISAGNLKGHKWSKFGNEQLLHVSIGEKFVWGIHNTSMIYILP